MKKRIIVIGICCFAALLISFDTHEIASTGAPIGSTGAPGEYSCAKAGCHVGSAVNSGKGMMYVSFDGKGNTYEPGKTYSISVTLNQENIKRFGFEVLVLRNRDHVNTGSLSIADSLRTQLLKGYNEFEGRRYVTYTYAGTEPDTPGLGQWHFQWTAPSTDEGPVTIYAATVAANNDGTDSGDWVYTRHTVIQPATVGITEKKQDASLAVFPNPAKNTVRVSFSSLTAIYTCISVTDLQGKKIKHVWEGMSHTGENNIQLALADAFTPGIYLLQVQNQDMQLHKKLIIE